MQFKILSHTCLIFTLTSACATQTAQLELDRANQTLAEAAAAKSQDCAQEIFLAAEAAYRDARKYSEQGDIANARAKADEAHELAKQARAECDRIAAENSSKPTDVVSSPGQSTLDVATEVSLEDSLGQLLSPVYFGYNQSTIPLADKTRLEELSVLLQQHNNLNIEIAGHCDQRGSTDYNLQLGQQRAQSVKKYMVTLGAPDAQIRVISFGKENPVNFEMTEEAHQANRRAELRRIQ